MREGEINTIEIDLAEAKRRPRISMFFLLWSGIIAGWIASLSPIGPGPSATVFSEANAAQRAAESHVQTRRLAAEQRDRGEFTPSNPPHEKFSERSSEIKNKVFDAIVEHPALRPPHLMPRAFRRGPRGPPTSV